MERIAVFGGTFNPIHKGHINLCMECNKHFSFDRILLIPSNIPPHKQVLQLADNQDRLEMCRLASLESPILEVSEVEIKRSGVSYTVGTLATLKQQYPAAELYLIIGSDMLFMFHKWMAYQEILDKVQVIVGAREEEEYQRMLDYKEKVLNNHQHVNIIPIDIFTVSSTEIRKRLYREKPLTDLLDSRVEQYIYEHSLYQPDKVEEVRS